MPLDSTLSRLLPVGLLATRQWLLDQDVSRHTLDNALKSGKLVAVSRGVVARPEVRVTWHGLAASLNRMLPGPVYVGGVTALGQAGLGHYLRSSERVDLYGSVPAPNWLFKCNLDMEVKWHSNRRLWTKKTFDMAKSLRTVESDGGWSYLVATPEQAFMEVLADVPDKLSFEYADQLMQGLTSLSPKRLDVLLRECRHIKVKRLFFFFADRHEYTWLKRLNRDAYDLGHGKRMVAKGGRLENKYLITVPEAFHGQK